MIVTVKELLTKDLRGKVVIFPTDTVYGIGCLLNDKESIQRIYKIKGRDYSKPFAILVASMEQVYPLVDDAKKIESYGKKYWPGALTLITKKSHVVHSLLTSGMDTVGIRMPDHEIAQKILRSFGPMVVTSLNLSSKPAILRFGDTYPFHKQVDYVIDGGDLSHSASTVFDTENNIVLRQGELYVEIQ